MVINLIVITALVLGGGYLLVWLLSPRLRHRIEQPKFLFQEKLAEYHKQHPADNSDEVETR